MNAEDMVIQVLNALADSLRVGDIVDKTGLDKKVVDKVMKDLQSSGSLHSPKRCFLVAK